MLIPGKYMYKFPQALWWGFQSPLNTVWLIKSKCKREQIMTISWESTGTSYPPSGPWTGISSASSSFRMACGGFLQVFPMLCLSCSSSSAVVMSTSASSMRCCMGLYKFPWLSKPCKRKSYFVSLKKIW